jgi:3',5'-cyclic AMP phosphodiesterase CpdA
MIKIVHISDLHFSFYTWNPMQIFSKRIIGNLNLLFNRKKTIGLHLLDEFLNEIDQIKPTHVLISGDFTSTSLPSEYEKSILFIQELKKRGIEVFALPGNHDAYTKKAYRKKTFYQELKECLPFKGEFNFSLEEHRVAAFKLTHDLYLVLVDAACYTPLFQSNGSFSFEIQEHLESLLENIPKESKIWLCSHFPFFEHEHPKRVLEGAKNLKALIEKFHQIEIYFHGHTHRQALVDLRENNLPIISDSGSLTLKHRSSYNVIDLKGQSLQLSRIQHQTTFQTVEVINTMRIS